MRQHFVLLFVRHARYQIGGIIRVHIVDKTTGDSFCRKRFDKMYSFLFVDFCQYVSCFFVIQQQEYELCPFIIQLLQDFCYICGVKPGNLFADLGLVAGIDQFFQLTQKFVG